MVQRSEVQSLTKEVLIATGVVEEEKESDGEEQGDKLSNNEDEEDDDPCNTQTHPPDIPITTLPLEEEEPQGELHAVQNGLVINDISKRADPILTKKKTIVCFEPSTEKLEKFGSLGIAVVKEEDDSPDTTVASSSSSHVVVPNQDASVPPSMPSLQRSHARYVASRPGAVFVQSLNADNNNQNEDSILAAEEGIELPRPRLTTATSAPMRLQTSSNNNEDDNSGLVISAELVVNEDEDNINKEAVLAVAERAPRCPWFNALAAVTTCVLIVVVIAVTVLLVTSDDGDRNKDDDNQYMESLQMGNTIFGDTPHGRLGNPIALSADATVLAMGARQIGDINMVRVVTTAATTQQNQNGMNQGKGGAVWGPLGNAIFAEAPGDEFALSGLAMSADAKRIAVGAVSHDVTTEDTRNRPSVVLPNAGNVRIFEFRGNALWTQVGNSLPGMAANDMFGIAVSMSSTGEIIAASAYQSNEKGENSGYVRIFRQRVLTADSQTVTWEQMGSTLLGRAAFDHLGRSLDMSADGLRIAAGATQQLKDEGPGYVQVFDFNGSDWNQVGQDIWGDNDKDAFGRDVSLSSDGSILAVGAPYYLADGNGAPSGLARVYELVVDNTPGNYGVGTWVQLGQTLLGTREDDGFGLSLSLSSSGMRLAVGASQKAGGAGYVRIFDYNINVMDEWLPLDHDLVGAMDLDEFGTDVQLSDSGDVVAVGSIGGDIYGEETGQVQVYDLSKLQSGQL